MATVPDRRRPISSYNGATLYASKLDTSWGNNGNIRNGVFVGELENGTMQKFEGSQERAVKEFKCWVRRQFRGAAAVEREERLKEEARGKSMTTQKQEQPRPQKLWALVYKRGNTAKVAMAFAEENAAYDAASVNAKALEVAGVDGEWTVDELEVRW